MVMHDTGEGIGVCLGLRLCSELVYAVGVMVTQVGGTHIPAVMLRACMVRGQDRYRVRQLG